MPPAQSPTYQLNQIGKALKERRHQCGYSQEDISHTLKIPLNKIIAMEAGDYREAFAPPYPQSFLSQYCRYLQIEIPDLESLLERHPSLLDPPSLLSEGIEPINPDPFLTKKTVRSLGVMQQLMIYLVAFIVITLVVLIISFFEKSSSL